MGSRRGSLLILVLIAAAVLAGKLLTDPSGHRADALAVTTAGLPGMVMFELGPRLDRYRVDVASARLAREEERIDARRAALRRRQERFRNLPGSVSRAVLESIASCESGGDPRVVSSNGLYHGKYQFSLGTWESVGGKGSPAEASEAEQDYRAALLYERSGPGQWPVCGS